MRINKFHVIPTAMAVQPPLKINMDTQQWWGHGYQVTPFRDTVDGNQKSGVNLHQLRLVVYISHYLQGFSTIPGGCWGFLNHQQYKGWDPWWPQVASLGNERTNISPWLNRPKRPKRKDIGYIMIGIDLCGRSGQCRAELVSILLHFAADMMAPFGRSLALCMDEGWERHTMLDIC